jgi:hypothetical protein
MTEIECDLQNHEALVAGEGSRRGPPVLILLCQRGRLACQAEQKQEHRGFGRTTHSLL